MIQNRIVLKCDSFLSSQKRNTVTFYFLEGFSQREEAVFCIFIVLYPHSFVFCLKLAKLGFHLILCLTVQMHLLPPHTYLFSPFIHQSPVARIGSRGCRALTFMWLQVCQKLCTVSLLGTWMKVKIRMTSCVFINEEKKTTTTETRIHSYTSFCVHLAGDMRIVRACIKCWTPQLFPKMWIWEMKKKTQKTINNNCEFLKPHQYHHKLECVFQKQTWTKCAAHLPTPAGQHRRWQSRYRCSPDPPIRSNTATLRVDQRERNLRKKTKHQNKGSCSFKDTPWTIQNKNKLNFQFWLVN